MKSGKVFMHNEIQFFLKMDQHKHKVSIYYMRLNSVAYNKVMQRKASNSTFYLRTDQLCLSNEQVLKLILKTLEQRFKENPEAKYWSVSPNDNNNYCECDLCRKIDNEDGGQQGSLIRFINKIAFQYPEKTFTTLAWNVRL